jgi:TolA-binding protein
MASPNNLPASDEPVYEIDTLELFWEQHKGKVIAGVLALVVAIVAVFGWMLVSNARMAAAEDAFSGAKTPADYQAVIAKYGSSPVAGDAALLLAKSLRDEKKYDEANQVLDRFAKTQPKHPLAPLAKVAAAENLALAGKIDEATQALENVALTDSQSFVAPFALLVEAELKSAQGKREGALQAYRQLAKTFPNSTATMASAQSYAALESLMPAPAASATPAPAKK